MTRRFSIDPTRIYVTGMSGGARVAMQIALAKGNDIAGVIAAGAGYPDREPRSTVPFAVFATTGTEGFDYLEMRQLDRKLKSPHALAVFDGLLGDDTRHSVALLRLRDRLTMLARTAGIEEDSPERSQARRLLRAVTAGSAERVQDPDYLRVLEEYGPRR